MKCNPHHCVLVDLFISIDWHLSALFPYLMVLVATGNTAKHKTQSLTLCITYFQEISEIEFVCKKCKTIECNKIEFQMENTDDT